MSLPRPVLSLSKELYNYCSVFDDVKNPVILVDSDRFILYRNGSFVEGIKSDVAHLSELTNTCVGLDEHLIKFFEQASVYDEFECPQGKATVRRVVSVENEFATITFHDVIVDTPSHVFGDGQWAKSLIEHAPEAILLLDFERKQYIDANPKAEKLFGCPKNQLLKSKLGDWSPKQLADGKSAAAVATANIEKCIETGESVLFNWEIKRPDGKLIPCEIRVVRLPTPQGIFIRSSITDVSVKKDAELQLQAQKDQFNKLFNSSVFAMVLCDKKGKIQYTNAAFRKLTGRKAPELKDVAFKRLLSKDDQKSHKARIEQVINKGKAETTARFRLKHADGTYKLCSASARSYEDWNGEVMVIKTIKDHSDEEEALQRLASSEKRFRSLFERNIIGIMLLNAKRMQVISVNEAACRILNRTEKEVIKNQSGLFKYDDAALQKINRSKIGLFAKSLIKGDGQVPYQDILFNKSKKETIVVRIQGFVLDQDSHTLVLGFTDITKAVTRKKQFIQRNNQLQAFVKHSIIPVAMFDREMNYLFVGDKWKEMYATDNEDVIGKNYYELHPGIPQRWKLIHRKGINGETIQKSKDLYIRRNGEEQWYRWLVKPWLENEESVGGIIIYAENITDEVIAAEEARKQEARYKSFFENSTLGWIEIESDKLIDYANKMQLETFSHDLAFDYFLDSTVVKINDQVREIFGIGDMHVEDFKPLEFIRGSVQGFGRKLIHNLRHDVRVFEYDVAINNVQGEERKLFISVRLPDNKDFRHIVFGVLDVTDLKSSISALRESEERYRTMFESNSLGVVYTNYKKSIIRVNAAFEEMFGYNEDEMQNLDEIDLLYPRYRKAHREMVSLMETGSKRFLSAEKEYKRKNGKRLIALTSSNALYDDEGIQYGAVTIIKDITEDKLNERKIRKQNEELKKINRELDQFVYSAAHDLRAPIANVLGLVTLLRMEDLPPTASHYVDLQEKSLDKLDEFIKSIVDYSRNSRLALAKSEIEWETYITDVVDQYRYSENAERLDISIEVKQNSPFVSDSNRLSVVMNNLVSNAVRYMDVEKERPFLKITVNSNSSSATIEVEDNGIGIEQKHLKSIFELFYRANSESKGTGIGLYIVKETVAKLKGKIMVKSKYKKGTKFTVRVKNFAPRKRKKR